MAYKEVKEKAERRFVVLSDISCSRVIRFTELVTCRKRICCHTAFLGFICSFAKKKCYNVGTETALQKNAVVFFNFLI